MRGSHRFEQILVVFEVRIYIPFRLGNHFATFREEHNFFFLIGDPFFLPDEIWKELLAKLQETQLHEALIYPMFY